MALPNPNVQESYYFERIHQHFVEFLGYSNLKFKKKFDKAYNKFVCDMNSKDALTYAITQMTETDIIRVCKAYLKREEVYKVKDFLNAITYCKDKLDDNLF